MTYTSEQYISLLDAIIHDIRQKYKQSTDKKEKESLSVMALQQKQESIFNKILKFN